MIFVTVGTHEQPFDRLIQYVDEVFKDEEVVFQYGYSKYIPKEGPLRKVFHMISQEAMTQYIKTAEIIITHGGPGSIMGVLKEGKTPIVVPRQAVFGEHINDHQVDFARHLEKEKRTLVVYDINVLKSMVTHLKNGDIDDLKAHVNHTQNFVDQLEKHIEDLFNEEKK